MKKRTADFCQLTRRGPSRTRYGNRHFEIYRDNNEVGLCYKYYTRSRRQLEQNEQITLIIIIILLLIMHKAHATHNVIYYMMLVIELSPILRNDAKTCFPSTRTGPSRKVGDDTTKTIAVWCIYIYYIPILQICSHFRVVYIILCTYDSIYWLYIYICVGIGSLYIARRRVYIYYYARHCRRLTIGIIIIIIIVVARDNYTFLYSYFCDGDVLQAYWISDASDDLLMIFY